jgi:hypothetical protein
MGVFRGKEYRYDVFITHNWGVDEQGRNNHDRAKLINESLKAHGIVTWFDGDRMHGDLVKKMTNGIDDSALVIVLVTKLYAAKVNGDNQADNCQTEFRYAFDNKTSSDDMIIPVVMEPCMRNPKTWGGRLQAGIGHLMYEDFSGEANLDECGSNLAKQVRDVLDGAVRVTTKASVVASVLPGDAVLTVSSGNSSDHPIAHDYRAWVRYGSALLISAVVIGIVWALIDAVSCFGTWETWDLGYGPLQRCTCWISTVGGGSTGMCVLTLVGIFLTLALVFGIFVCAFLESACFSRCKSSTTGPGSRRAWKDVADR